MTLKYVLSLLAMTLLLLYSAVAGSISGTVTSNGNPVVGASVVAIKVPFDSTIIAAYSDSGGIYLLQNVPAGQYHMRCVHHNIVVEDSALVTVGEGASVEGVNFELPLIPPLHNSISGKITNKQSNEPIVNATARLSDRGSTFLTVQADSDGNFSFSDVPVGTYYLSVVADGFNGLTYSHELFIDYNTHLTGLNIALEPLIDYHNAIAGHVYDSVSGKPIVGAMIFDNIYTFRYDSVYQHWAFTDSTGFYILKNLFPRTYMLTCSADGYVRSTKTDVVVAESETTTANFYLQPLSTGTITGIVTLTDGTPIAGAQLEFIPIPWGSGRGSKSTTSDSTGAYSTNLLSGDYYVSCAAQIGEMVFYQWYGSGQLTVLTPVTVLENQTTAGIDFVFQIPRQIHITVSGIVTDRSGNPLQGALVSAGLDSMIRCSAMDHWGSAQTGSDGHYELAMTITAREQYRFVVSARDKGYQVQYYNDKPVPWLAEIFTVNSDTTLSGINFALDTITANMNSISGTVTASSGQPIYNGFVFASGKIAHDAHMALTDSSGNYTLHNLFDEQYYIVFAARGFAAEIYNNVSTWDQATTVEANGAVTGIDAVLDSALNDTGHGSIIGRVHDHHGNPLAGVFMILIHDQHGIVGSTMTLSDGTYSLENVGTGQYSLIGSKAGYSTSTQAISITSSSSGTAALNLDLTYDTPSTTMNVATGWNLVSLPMRVSDGRVAAVFPLYNGSFYQYTNQGYSASGQLSHGTGYWMKNASMAAFDISGEAVTAETIGVAQGWNMIGALSVPVPVSAIMSTQQGFVTSQFFGYGNGYVGADTLLPGKGYWVKVDAAGMLVISPQSSGALHSITVTKSTELPPASPSNTQAVEVKPTTFALDQNYPNPFNPTTTIKYQLPNDSKVVVTIYNVIGQVVATLVNSVETAGYKEVTWNAENAASGVYYYRINAVSVDDPTSTFTYMKKMLLVK
jgi:hypothetical protein